MSPVTIDTRAGLVAEVRVSVDFPDAEGIWVTAVPVYERESISDAIAEAAKSVLDSLARDAGGLYAARVKYGKGLPQS